MKDLITFLNLIMYQIILRKSDDVKRRLNAVFCLFVATCFFGVSCSNDLSLDQIPVLSGEKWGYINSNGEYVIEPQFRYAQFFHDGLALVVSPEGKIGYIKKNGKYAFEAKFKEGTPFKDGLAVVVSEGGYPTYIDKSGNTKFELKQAKHAFAFSEGLAMFVASDNKYGFVDKSGKVVINPQFEEAHKFSEGFAAVEQRGKWGFIDKTGKIVINPQFEGVGFFEKGKTYFYDGKQWGFIDTKGKYIINPQFEGLFPFSEGLATFSQNDECGYINEDGKIEINPQFESAGLFSNGLAIIRHNEKLGYINKTGTIEISPQFDNVSSFCGGVAFVESNDRWGIIDKKGQYRVNPVFDFIGFNPDSYFSGSRTKSLFTDAAYEKYLEYNVTNDYYDATGFISKFFSRFSEQSVEGFGASSTLQNIADNSVYGDVRANDYYRVDYSDHQPLTKDIIIDKVSFYFDRQIYEYSYSAYYSRMKEYDYNANIKAISYSFDLSNEAYQRGKAVANVLKTEIENRFKVKMEDKNGKYVALPDEEKISFAIDYSDYSVTLYCSFTQKKLKNLLGIADNTPDKITAKQETATQEQKETEPPTSKATTTASITGTNVIIRESYSTTSKKLGNFDTNETVKILDEYYPSNSNEAIVAHPINLSNSSGQVVYTLPKGKAVKIISRNNTKVNVSFSHTDYGTLTADVNYSSLESIAGEKWYKVRRNNGETGWVFSKYVKIAQ
jgi:hypothetical protein